MEGRTPYITVKYVMQVLRKERCFVSSLVRRGKLQGVKQSGKPNAKWLITVASFNNFLATLENYKHE